MEMDEVEAVAAPSDPKAEDVEVVEPDTYTFSESIENLEDISKEKIRSAVHVFAGFKWRLLIFPKGNDAPNALSVYLECNGPAEETNGQIATKWKKAISFKLILYSHGPESRDIVKESQHVFTESETDWGFREFALFEHLNSMEESYMVNRTVKLGATLSLKTIEEYDSKKETGFNGFKNQGATCYMNSLLQVLFTLGEFRRSVFMMKCPEESEADKIPFALQKVFYDLQNGDTAVKTKKLTRSFGWDSADAFTQQDVQELNRLLCTHLEEVMRKSNGKNKISELFEGKEIHYIECVNVPYKSTREESFFDLSLTVQGSRTIHESFEKYTEVQLLDGDNKYKADGYEELQEARMGVKFGRLPPVLQLHLKRFDYDLIRDVNVKINDRFEFPAELDLRKYLENSDGSEVYVLHAVLVHVGEVNAGHYYVYIRPYVDTVQWYKFDDEMVTLVDEKEAIQDNFGSPTPRKLSSAYMLQYIKKDKVGQILKRVAPNDIPEELEERVRVDRQEEDMRKKEKEDMYLYMEVVIIREETLQAHTGVDLIPWDRVDKKSVKKETTLRELRDQLKSSLAINEGMKIRIWKMVQRPNNSVRTDRLLTAADDDTPLHQLSKPNADLQLFVQQIPITDEDALKPGEIIQFFKIYAPKPVPVLSYVGSLICHRDWRFRDVMTRLMQWDALHPQVREAIRNGEAKYFEELAPQHISAVDPDSSFAHLDIKDGGDIVVIQLPTTVNSGAIAPNIKLDGPLPFQGQRDVLTVDDYFSYLMNRRYVQFRDIQKPNENGIRLELLKTDTYYETRYWLSQALRCGVPPERIRLYPYDAQSQGPRLESISQSHFTTRPDNLETMLETWSRPGMYTTPEVLKIFWYEFTEYDLEEFETKEEVRITWRPDGGTAIPGYSDAGDVPLDAPSSMQTTSMSLLVPRTATYADVVKEMRYMLDIADDISIRLLEIKGSFICRSIHESDLVPRGMHRGLSSMYSDDELRAEPDAMSKVDTDHIGRVAYKMVPVLHIPKGNHANPVRYFGDPFLLPVRQEGETVGMLRERIRTRTMVPEEEFKTWRLAAISSSTVEFLTDDEMNWEPAGDNAEELTLAIEHKRKTPIKKIYGLVTRDKPLVFKING